MEEIKLTKKQRKTQKRQEKTKEVQKKATKRIIKKMGIWTFVIICIAIGVFLTVSAGGSSVVGEVRGISAEDWTKGNNLSKNVLIEYTDYQCPICSLYHKIIDQLIKSDGDKFLFAVRNFPLPMHEYSTLAAATVEASGLQGKFWEMQSLIFENQEIWSKLEDPKETFIEYAKKLNLNIEQLQKDVESKKVKDKIEKEFKEAEKANLPGTPTFFLNGKKIKNPGSYEEFQKLINQ